MVVGPGVVLGPGVVGVVVGPVSGFGGLAGEVPGVSNGLGPNRPLGDGPVDGVPGVAVGPPGPVDGKPGAAPLGRVPGSNAPGPVPPDAAGPVPAGEVVGFGAGSVSNKLGGTASAGFGPVLAAGGFAGEVAAGVFGDGSPNGLSSAASAIVAPINTADSAKPQTATRATGSCQSFFIAMNPAKRGRWMALLAAQFGGKTRALSNARPIDRCARENLRGIILV